MLTVRIEDLFGRTTMQTGLIEIKITPVLYARNVGHEQIGQQVQKKIDKLLERTAKGKLNTRVVVM